MTDADLGEVVGRLREVAKLWHPEVGRLLTQAADLLQSERADNARLRAALEPFAEIATPKYPGEAHTSPLYGLERQTGTGELRLYSPFSDCREELPMLAEHFRAARTALHPTGDSQQGGDALLKDLET